MEKAALALGVALVCLVPVPASAQHCFGAGPFVDIIVAYPAGQGGPFYAVVGEVVNWCGTGTSMPMSGSAHVTASGHIHVGISVHGPVGANPATCVPGWYQGTINGPAYQSGAGFLRNAFGFEQAITFTRVACPSIPQEPQASDGPAGGTAR